MIREALITGDPLSDHSCSAYLACSCSVSCKSCSSMGTCFCHFEGLVLFCLVFCLAFLSLRWAWRRRSGQGFLIWYFTQTPKTPVRLNFLNPECQQTLSAAVLRKKTLEGGLELFVPLNWCWKEKKKKSHRWQGSAHSTILFKLWSCWL